MVQGVKSKYFGCFWDSMFLAALSYPSRIDKNDSCHIEKMIEFKRYYDSFKHIIPCKFCREFTKDVLEKYYPLNFTGRVALMRSLYTWRDQVNKKLIKKSCSFTKPSPPFDEILAKYEKLRAKCDKKVGKCI
jgi:hypothetical protein